MSRKHNYKQEKTLRSWWESLFYDGNWYRFICTKCGKIKYIKDLYGKPTAKDLE